MMDRNTLRVEDATGKVIALCLSNMEDSLKLQCKTLAAKMASIYPGEIYSDDSTKKGYSFLAQHYNMAYNRYAERVSVEIDFS